MNREVGGGGFLHNDWLGGFAGGGGWGCGAVGAGSEGSAKGV